MNVAPYESCVGCFKGDTTTTVVVEGEAEYHIAVMHGLTGMTIEQAAATLAVAKGSPRGMVPTGRFTGGFRLCRACAGEHADKILVDVSAVDSGEPVPGYVQTDEGGDGPEAG